MRGALFTSLATILLCAAAGCAEPDLGPPWAEIGAGESAFSPLDDGDTIQIVGGPQGGFMMALAVRAGGIGAGDERDPSDPSNPRITFRAWLAGETDPVGIITLQRGMAADGSGELETHGTWLIFNPAVGTELYFDATLTLEVKIVDAAGRTAQDEVEVYALSPLETGSLNFDVDPGEIVRRPNDDTEHAAAEVGHPHQQVVSHCHGLATDLGVGATLEGHVAKFARALVVVREEQRLRLAANEEELITGCDVRIIDAGEMQCDVSGDRRAHRIDELDEGSRAQQKVIARGDLRAVLAHAKAPIWQRRGAASLNIDPMPATALERRLGALLEDQRQIALTGRVGPS